MSTGKRIGFMLFIGSKQAVRNGLTQHGLMGFNTDPHPFKVEPPLASETDHMGISVKMVIPVSVFAAPDNLPVRLDPGSIGCICDGDRYAASADRIFPDVGLKYLLK